ncbi:Fungalysin metallopeptidase-domain-containing protein [Polychytrium aggregatum]|uniref:Fungalysin metallopeptidase-domain-containing protein n=1 Tax=Polychytrium aggregatum TaxID=110093 RepID=UPI0022FE74A1|nr:Fungalysin metallopeptidase-domain-containing protein [Polychytrium aggregatum]KAI9193710.1 Fungalysin metallopeptidase-domain-containing protein [Polychytrium aggregatum]
MALVWNINLELISGAAWYDVFVDCNDGTIIAVSDWINRFSPATYRVVPFSTTDLGAGPQALVSNPADANSSPAGWHDDGTGEAPSTHGNNVYAQENRDRTDDPSINYRPTVSDSYTFDFVYDTKQSPQTNQDASITQLFYMVNIAHDVFYAYGFTEAAGNFQNTNFGKGGVEGDPVEAFAQDGTGVNNANFATPPDGDRGRMRMFIFTKTTPNRDGAMDNAIIAHEYGHGVSNRLTGGKAQSNCLTAEIPYGMGEGWSDFFAILFTLNASQNRTAPITMGAYTMGSVGGARKYPYSSSVSVNPLTYGALGTFKSPRNPYIIGQAWAQMLLDMMWNLVDKYGFEPDIRNSQSPKGNIVAFHLVMDALKLQPCNPDFISARNAILLADQVGNNAANSCEIWRAFAGRGLGTAAAAGVFKNSTDLPEQCVGPKSGSGCTSVGSAACSTSNDVLVCRPSLKWESLGKCPGATTCQLGTFVCA